MSATTEQLSTTHGRSATWGLSWWGVRTVARLELRQRVRSSRWVVVLVVWTAVLAILTALIRWSVHRSYGFASEGLPADQVPAQRAAESAQSGRVVFGIVVLLVLSLGALVAPALSATSVNGDRAAGVLATLQTTLLTPAEIVVGKLLAAWAVALAFLACALPFVVWAYTDGGTPVVRVLVVLAVLALTLLVVCSVGLGWSATAARTSSSAVLTYLTVAMLGLGLPLLFALCLPLVTSYEKVTTRQSVSTNADGTTFRCDTVVQDMSVQHTERIWWLLAASPYVVLADAAPVPAPARVGAAVYDDGSDPLSAIRNAVRDVRLGPDHLYDWCGDGLTSYAPGQDPQSVRSRQRDALGVTWPYGLATDVALGLAFTVVAVRRLRTPSRVLPRGTRVA